jgi:hypothetical protein
MQDRIRKNDKTDNTLGFVIPSNVDTIQELIALMQTGITADISANPDGATVQGTPLNKQTLLDAATAAKIFGADSVGATVSAALSALLDATRIPVGGIYPTIINQPPSYGTWAAWGSGRMIVGVNTADADFNAPNKTGGAKAGPTGGTAITIAQMPSHTHTQDAHTHTPSTPSQQQIMTRASTGGNTSSWFSAYGVANGPIWNAASLYSVQPYIYAEGGSQPHTHAQTMPPYITCYMFVRTA